jgi:hypothetical protein
MQEIDVRVGHLITLGDETVQQFPIREIERTPCCGQSPDVP